MNLKHTISAAALTAALVVGGTTAAFAGNSGDGSAGTDHSARVTALCEHQDEIVAHLTQRQSNLTERIARLTELQTKATADGRTKLADRIGKRITHLQRQLDRVTNRIAKAPTWIAEHCS